MTTTMMRAMTMLLMLVLPGGLLALAAWLFARAVAMHLQHEPGPHFGQRLARAVSAVSFRDVWRDARSTLSFR